MAPKRKHFSPETEEKAGKKKGTNYNYNGRTFADYYPEREGYPAKFNRTGLLHVGYVSPNTRPCLCGAYPVFEQYRGDLDEKGNRNLPARSFVAICPMCELRGKDEGDLEYVLEQWNRREFSPDSLLVHEPMKNFSFENIKELADSVLLVQVEDAIKIIKQKKRFQKVSENRLVRVEARENACDEIRACNGRLRAIERFFRTSPMMGDHDPEAVISNIRKLFHPGNTRKAIEERLRIPLRLTAI